MAGKRRASSEQQPPPQKRTRGSASQQPVGSSLRDLSERHGLLKLRDSQSVSVPLELIHPQEMELSFCDPRQDRHYGFKVQVPAMARGGALCAARHACAFGSWRRHGGRLLYVEVMCSGSEKRRSLRQAELLQVQPDLSQAIGAVQAIAEKRNKELEEEAAVAGTSSEMLGQWRLHLWQVAAIKRLRQIEEGGEEVIRASTKDNYYAVSSEHIQVMYAVREAVRGAILVAAVGAGKTLVGLGLAARGGRTLVVVHPNAVGQWTDEGVKAGLPARAVRNVQGFRDSWADDAVIICSMRLIESAKGRDMSPLLSVKFRRLILDEVHMFTGPALRTIASMDYQFAFAFTATNSGMRAEDVANALGFDYSRDGEGAVDALREYTLKVKTPLQLCLPSGSVEPVFVDLTVAERRAYELAATLREETEFCSLFLSRAEGDTKVDAPVEVWSKLLDHVHKVKSRIIDKVVSELSHVRKPEDRAALLKDIEKEAPAPLVAKIRDEVKAHVAPDEVLGSYARTRAGVQPRIDQYSKELKAAFQGDRYVFETLITLDMASAGGSSPLVTCPICMEDIRLLDARIRPCAHFACQSCAAEEERRLASCPVCRKPWQGVNTYIQASKLYKKQDEPKQQDPALNKYGSKLTKLVELAKADPEERILVIAPNQEHLPRIERALTESGASCLRLTGNSAARDSRLQRWKTGEARLLLMAGQVPSLNLTLASRVVLLTPSVDTTNFTQALGRVLRQGSKHRQVTVSILACKDTVEDTLLQAQLPKFNKVVQDVLQKVSSGTT